MITAPSWSAEVDGRRMLRMVGIGTVWTICGIAGYLFWFYPHAGMRGVDAHAYWSTGQRSVLYQGAPGSPNAYLYSPAFAMLIWPLTKLAWPAFLGIWIAAESLAFAWLLRPLGLRWGPPVFMLCLIEVTDGNIYGFVAVAAVVGMRRPAAWALPLLTKITPGVGPLWFALRRDWRAVRISLGATAVIAAVSFAIAPHEWIDWYRFLINNSGNGQWFFTERVICAIVLVGLAAWRRKPWVLAFAMLLANPVVIHSWMDLTVLAAVPRLALTPRNLIHVDDREVSTAIR